MPHLVFAALVVAGVWLAARAVRSMTQEQPAKDRVDADRSMPITRLRQDPKTGIYRPEDE